MPRSRLTEELDEDFLSGLTDRVIQSLSSKLDELDISLDYIASLIGDEGLRKIAVRQKVSPRLREQEDNQSTKEE